MFGGRFQSSEPFVGAADLQAQKNLGQYYGEKRPNAILTGLDTSVNLKSLTGTYFGKTNDFVSPIKSNYALPNNSMSGDTFAKNNAACMTAGGGSSAFKRLSYLANNVDPKQKMRCGWVYNSTDPAQGGGAYGTRDGPLDTNFQGEWFWNLADAKQKYHKTLCEGVKDCGDLGGPNSPYSQICGYCTTSRKGIPIAGSIAAYPYDPRASCSPTAIITSASGCPKPTPQMVSAAAANVAVKQTSDTPAFTAATSKALNACDPFANGRLPRQCLIKKAGQVGCSEDGSLITSLKSGSEDNYFSELTKVPSYSEYQKRTDNSISEQSLKQGAATLDVILAQFQGIKDNTASAANLGLKAAATDLCMTNGSFEAFDFCIEFKDTDYTASIPLDCLQKEFLRGGGQKTGTEYPSTANLAKWRRYSTWREFKGAIENLGTKALNTADRVSQQDAIKKLQGIPVDTLRASLGDSPGVEIFWFTPEADIKSVSSTYNGCFLGRRIRSDIPNLVGASTAMGASNSRASFVFFTNIKPQSNKNYNMKFNGDSGFILLKNKKMEYNYSGGSLPKKDQEFSSLYNSFSQISEASTSQDGYGGSWSFANNTNNIILGYYFGQGTNFSLKFIEDAGIPPECKCYGRPSSDNTIRLYSNDECNLLGGNWYGNGECIRKSGGSYSGMCAGLNAQSPCTNDWAPISSDSLFLIQETFAPMISFNVVKNFQNYNCNYAFCDKRLGSHKMTWQPYANNGPVWNHPGPVTDDTQFPLGMSYGAMNAGAGMWSNFSFKRYSFMTLVLILRFTKLPANGVSSTPLFFWPSDWSIGYPNIIIKGNESGNATLNIGTGIASVSSSTDGPTLKLNTTYLITMRMNRTNDTDIYSLNSIQIGAGVLTDLQESVQEFNECSPIVYPNPRQLENPDIGYITNFLFKSDASCNFDVFSIQMYDYKLNQNNLKRAANNDWSTLDDSVYN